MIELDVEAGQSWEYFYKAKKFKLIVTKIEDSYSNASYEIQILEI